MSPSRSERVHLRVLDEHELGDSVEEQSSIRRDGSRADVEPADVQGRFHRARQATFLVLLAVYVALPWVKIGGHPALFLDIEQRSFYLFGATFNAQDLWLSVFVVTGAFFGLVALTAVAGRVWCGWACPQTVFLEALFRRVERLIEGPREKRVRRNAGSWTLDKTWRKTLAWVAYTLLAFVVAHVFLAYFVSVPRLWEAMHRRPSEHPEAFAIVMSVSALLLFNFGWFREQFCMILCPYGRLQSALLDKDSLVVGYDRVRGEPRGKVSKRAAGESVGDCVDCNRCVVVCPTGIDIRNGLQMDCVACTACIDACDAIMDKLGRPRGLVRYDSQRGLAGETRRIWRPRLTLYAVLGAAGLIATTFGFRSRVSFEANVLRVQGAPYVVDGGVVRNAFTVHLVNKRGITRTFDITPKDKPENVELVLPMKSVTLAPFAAFTAPVFITVPTDGFRGDFVVRLRLMPNDNEAEARVVEAPFLGPR